MGAPKPTPAAIRRAIEGMMQAGLPIAGVEVFDGGRFRVLAGEAHQNLPSAKSEVDEWDRATGLVS